MPNSNTYVWLVKQGTVKIWLEAGSIRLSVDPEGSCECELTRQDALEIASILYHLIGEQEKEDDVGGR